MAQVIVTESSLQNIAGAIRSKLGTQDTYTPSEMAGAISQIHGDPVLEALSVNANGTYTPTSGKDGFSQAVVNVPNSYSSGDEGKVVSGGALVAQSSQSITQNGTYDTTLKNQAIVNVPNSYSASDEGKVVSNGALVAQSSQTITDNGTYDTTLKNRVTVNVSGGGGGIQTGITPPTSDMGSDGDAYVQKIPIPSNVNFVEYLASSGTQYINTNIYPTNNNGIYCEIESTNQWGCGARNNNYGSNALNIGGNSDMTNGFHLDYGTARYNQSVSRGEKVKVSYIPNKALMTVNAKQWAVLKASNYTITSPFVLFGIGKSGTVTTSTNAKIYRCALYDGYNIIHDYLPCLDGNGVACMWDNVTQEYVYNDGTGDFAYGGAITPTEIDPILYVKENGAWRVVG